MDRKGSELRGAYPSPVSRDAILPSTRLAFQVTASPSGSTTKPSCTEALVQGRAARG